MATLIGIASKAAHIIASASGGLCAQIPDWAEVLGDERGQPCRQRRVADLR